MTIEAFATGPAGRGRVLMHVVDLDDGAELRAPAASEDIDIHCQRTGALILRGDRVRLLRWGWYLAKGTSRSGAPEGVYRGTWYVRPEQRRAA